jgi:chromosome segregation ATPase
MINSLQRMLGHTLALVAMIALPAGIARSQVIQVGIVSQVDTFAVVVSPRAVEDIKKDIDAVQANRAHAQAWKQTATDAVQKLEKLIDVKKKEIDTLEALQDSADAAKKDVEVAALKAQTKGVENILDLLKEQKKMHSLEVEAAAATIDYADAAVSAFEKESALATKRQERMAAAKSGSAPGALAELDKAIRELETSFLDLQSKSLDKQDRFVSSQQDLVKQQSDVADAQAKIRER